MAAHPVILPDGQATLGVMGGGQLGRMFVQAAQQMGYRTAVLEPDAASPAGWVAHEHVRTGYEDVMGLTALANVSAAITTEFENVPAASLRQLATHRPVAPAGDAVAVCQDRATEKAHFVASGVPCAPHARLESDADLVAIDAARLLPGILKTSRMGYDGKGQRRVRDAAELAQAWVELGRVPCLLEKMLPLAAELSVVVARGADGQCVHLPVQRNLHRAGILAVTTVPAEGIPVATQDAAIASAERIAAELAYVGVLCVEFFVLADGSLVANEMAPRPHNSGHHSIDSCDVSQFDLQVRTLAGLPLVAPRLHSATVMLNLLGDLWFDAAGRERAPDWSGVLALPGTHLHLYGKTEVRRARKMGHLTITAATPEAARAVALQAAAVLGFEPF
jgi:5-(carboxyamino)imidazole ribonucleotide synthase